MKPIKVLFVILFTTMHFIFAQNNLVTEITANSATRCVVLFNNVFNNFEYDKIGTRYAGNLSETFRCGAYFTFTIPANVRIIEAKLYVSITNPGASGQCKVNLLSSFDFSGLTAAQFYNTVAGGTNIGTVNNNSNINVDVKNHITGQSSLYIGFVGSPESANNQAVSTYLTIKYERVAVFTVQNSPNYGILNVNGSQVSSGSQVAKFTNESVTLGAVDQVMPDNYQHAWAVSSTNPARWENVSATGITKRSDSRNYSFAVAAADNGTTYQAVLPKLCNVTVSANRPNLWIKVNGTQYNCPAVANAIVEGEVQLEAQAEYYDEINELKHYFQNWSDGNPNRSRSIQINSHTPIQAVYKTYPAFPASKRNASQDNDNNNIGMPVKITWNEHPSSSVTSYEIWRRVKTGTAVKVADVNRGVCYYEDNSYTYGTYQQNFVLFYDVRPYYSPDATLAPENCNIMAYGRDIAAQKVKEIEGKETASVEEVITTGIDNYPNPFNPATTIRYSLAEGGKVSIKVYDIAGKEVAVLVDEVKEKGRYQVTFDGSKLASGPYFYRMTAPDYAVTKKILLMK